MDGFKMYGRVDGWMYGRRSGEDGWMDVQKNVNVYEHVFGWIDGEQDELILARTNEQVS